MEDGSLRAVQEPVAPRLLRGGLDCGGCQVLLASFVDGRLELSPVREDGAVSLHLQDCGSCAETFRQLLELAAAPQMQRLQDTLLDRARAPAALAGLLDLWRLYLGLSNRLDDERGVALGLSAVGSICGAQGQDEEAAGVLELALSAAKEAHDPHSRLVSHINLGALALRQGHSGPALDHLTRALREASRLGDLGGRARALLLLGDAWRLRGDAGRARQQVELAREQAEQAGDRLALEQAGQRLRGAAPGALWQTTREGCQRLGAEIVLTISRMKAGFASWPAGLQPVPVAALAPVRAGNAEAWALRIPEEEGRAGFDVELSAASPSGRRLDLTLRLVERPSGLPVRGAEVTALDERGMVPDGLPSRTDEQGAAALQLWPGRHLLTVTSEQGRREVPLAVVCQAG